jgi:single-stranded-DNA-specific exonuclease
MTQGPTLVERDAPPRTCHALEAAGVHPLLARLFAGRGVRSIDELNDDAARLLPPATLKGAREAAVLLADSIEAEQRICIVADYDCDGATACAVAVRGLAMLGVRREALHYVVPDRRVHGYGLTPAIAELARAHAPALLITVDNGIASVEGVARARELGMKVLVTDHHLPAIDSHGEVHLPGADVIVNPNQPGCEFASKSIAGVGVMFYVLLALRALLRERGHFSEATQPRLDRLLDLVALGTVADVVKLDANNRRLVAQGLRRVRAGRMQPGVAALLAAAGREAAHQRRGPTGRHDTGDRMPAHRRCGTRPRAGRCARRHQPPTTRSAGRHARAGRGAARRAAGRAGAGSGGGAVRPGLSRRRGRHRRRPRERSLAPPEFRVRAWQ